MHSSAGEALHEAFHEDLQSHQAFSLGNAIAWGKGGSVGLGRLLKIDTISLSPLIDEASEGVIGDELDVNEKLLGFGAGAVASIKPSLDARSVIGLSSGKDDRIAHEFQGNGAPEILGWSSHGN